jgi:hypothetical protein
MKVEDHGRVDVAAAALPLVRSSLIAPPFAHGFSTRVGGVSAAPFDTLNMGARWGDVPANVEENRPPAAARGRRRWSALRRAPGPRRGRRARARRRRSRGHRAHRGGCADHGRPRVALGIFVADCIPA